MAWPAASHAVFSVIKGSRRPPAAKKTAGSTIVRPSPETRKSLRVEKILQIIWENFMGWERQQHRQQCDSRSPNPCCEKYGEVYLTNGHSRCGFCQTTFKSYAGRTQHIAQHFQHGRIMALWKGSWGLMSSAVEFLHRTTTKPEQRDLKIQHPFADFIRGDHTAEMNDIDLSNAPTNMEELQQRWDKETAHEMQFYVQNRNIPQNDPRINNALYVNFKLQVKKISDRRIIRLYLFQQT
ncbi:hypothetical protein FPQ18DRAFT_96305 [Pyronema domesticum]|nr:hypothetical protein FPQ18DRAFT_96305 [Pyronema domesticum]